MTTPADDRRASDRIDVSDAGIGHRFGHFRHPVVRGAAFIMALGVFFFAANVIDPGQSSAVDGSPAQISDRLVDSSDLVSTGSLGALNGLTYTVEIHATAQGPRYTVIDADGAILGAMLEALEVEQVAPGLELEGMLTEPLMLAEPRSTFEH